MLVLDSEIVGNPEMEIHIVTLDFLANWRFDDDGNYEGGDNGYPFPNTNTDSTVGEVGDPAVIARVGAQSIVEDGVRTGDVSFADN